MRRAVVVAMGALGAFGAFGALAVACGDVPTLADSIAFVTAIVPPAPAVAYGDTLRDSVGRAAPLRVFAIGRGGDTISGVATTFLLTSLRSGATVDANGYLVAPDSLLTLRIVAQVGGRLQTPELSFDVVRRADAMGSTVSRDTSVRALPLVDSLSVTVTGLAPGGVRGAAKGIIVRYRTRVFPASAAADRRFYLVADGGRVLRPDSTVAVDTSDVGGIASRTLIALRATGGEAEVDSVVVQATAHSLRDTTTLAGGPVRFVLRVRKP